MRKMLFVTIALWFLLMGQVLQGHLSSLEAENNIAIYTFVINPRIVDPNQPTTLSWNVTGATKLYLVVSDSGLRQEIPNAQLPIGSYQYTLLASTTFVLVAEDAQGQTVKSQPITVTVCPCTNTTPDYLPTSTPALYPQTWKFGMLVRVRSVIPFSWLRVRPSSYSPVLDTALSGSNLAIESAAATWDGVQWWWLVKRIDGSIVGYVEQNALELTPTTPNQVDTSPTLIPATYLPQLVSFSSDAPIVRYDGSITLRWKTVNTVDVHIFGSGFDKSNLPSEGTITIPVSSLPPSEVPLIFYLEGHSSAGMIAAIPMLTTEVHIDSGVVVRSFTVEPLIVGADRNVMLTWNIFGASRLYLIECGNMCAGVTTLPQELAGAALPVGTWQYRIAEGTQSTSLILVALNSQGWGTHSEAVNVTFR